MVLSRHGCDTEAMAWLIKTRETNKPMLRWDSRMVRGFF